MEYTVMLKQVNNELGESIYSYGSGIILDNGYILTNQHVVGPQVLFCKIYWTLQNKMLTFKRLVKHSVWYDLALIEIEEKIIGMKLADKLPKLGSVVQAIGYGNASGGNRIARIINTTLLRYEVSDYIAPIDMAIGKVLTNGMSGGPIIYNNQVIGVNDKGQENTCYAVPLFSIKKFMAIDAKVVDDYIYKTLDYWINDPNTIYGKKISLDNINMRSDGKINLRDLGFTEDDVYINIMYAIEYLGKDKELELEPVSNFFSEDYAVIHGLIILSSCPYRGVGWDDRGIPGLYIQDVTNYQLNYLKGKIIVEPRRIKDINDYIVVEFAGVPIRMDLNSL